MSPSPFNVSKHTEWVGAALRALQVDHLALIVFDSALPQAEPWDVGTGSPYSALARDFFAFARQLGFTGIQFGPQGLVSRDCPSPYDSAAFSRNPLSIALDSDPSEIFDDQRTAWRCWVTAEEMSETVEEMSETLAERSADVEQRVFHAVAFDRQYALLRRVAERLREATTESGPLLRRFSQWRQRAREWLFADGLYDCLCQHYGVGDYSQFSTFSEGPLDARLWHADVEGRSLRAAGPDDGEFTLLGYALAGDARRRLAAHATRFKSELSSYAWIQFIAHRQHEALHNWARAIGLELYGDLQIGYSRRDRWHFATLFLRDYCLGAPPSRTNPEGQPWGYPLLDPALCRERDGAAGPALQLARLRAQRCFVDYDRVRVDHPHGWVCPWVYRAESGDDLYAVQHGARLFSSPDLYDHPALARYALVAAKQLDKSRARYADGWVRYVTKEQTERFCAGLRALVECARRRGDIDRLICEVLSTQPTELGAVRGHLGLGRFRVTQKANLDDPADVYLSDNAEAEDWMLLGNHDTPTIWQLIERWNGGDEHECQARYLARRLTRDEAHRAALYQRLRRDPVELAHAKLADLFVADARNVMISFGDLFGFKRAFNVPGTIDESNWSQRLPRAFREVYARKLASGDALDLSRALRMALERVAPGSALLGQP